MKYGVNEIFHSVQGEGMHTGRAATFIRLQGCTVGCPWCDSGPLADLQEGRMSNGQTRNTWGAGGQVMTAMEIVMRVTPFWDQSCDPHIIITGGEPTIYNLDELMNELSGAFGRWPYIQLETSGQNALKGENVPDWITWSPKQNLNWDAPDSIKLACKEVKFVVDEHLPEQVIADTEGWYTVHQKEWEEFHGSKELFKTPEIVLMPEGCPPTTESMKRSYDMVIRHPTWRVMDRLQYRMGVR